MSKSARVVVWCSVVALGVSASGAAGAQYYASAGYPQPLYPYAVPQQPQAIIVVPQGAPRAYPYVQPNAAPAYRGGARIIKREIAKPVAAAPASKRKVSKTDPVLVEELRAHAAKNPVIKKTIVVREKPVVREHVRVVDHPIVIRRETIVDDDPPRGLIRKRDNAVAAAVPAPVEVAPPPPPAPAPVIAPAPAPAGPRAGKPQRVIRAEAEVTILGPDRMSIRLFRKRGEAAPPPVALQDE